MIPKVKEIVHWNEMGQGSCELYICQTFKVGEINIISSKDASLILELKGYDINQVDTNKKYGLFYQYHPSNGYKTEIQTHDGIVYDGYTEKPKGGVLCAFWSEGIVFELI